MADFTELFLQGVQAGQQARQRKQQEVHEAEDRSVRKMLLDLELKKLKVEEKVRARELAKENLSLLQGQPAANLPADITQTPELPASMAQTALSGGPLPQPAPIPRAPVTIPGIEELGIGSVEARPQSLEEILHAARVKALSTPTKLSSGEALVIPGTGQTIASGPAKPKSFQSKNVRAQGFTGMANFDPDSGQYFAPGSDQPLQNVQDAPPQVDPTLSAIRDATLANLRAQGNVSPKQVITFNQIAGAYERSPLVRAADRTIVLNDAIKTIEANPTDPAAQLRLAYSYIQALDTYQSAVREGELGNLGALWTKLQLWQVQLNKVASEGAFLPKEVAQNIARDAKQLVTTIETAAQRKRQEFGARAQVSGVGPMWQEFVTAAEASTTPRGETTGAPKVGDPVTYQGKAYRVKAIVNGEAELEPVP